MEMACQGAQIGQHRVALQQPLDGPVSFAEP
jgi:hypothetical protein